MYNMYSYHYYSRVQPIITCFAQKYITLCQSNCCYLNFNSCTKKSFCANALESNKLRTTEDELANKNVVGDLPVETDSGIGRLVLEKLKPPKKNVLAPPSHPREIDIIAPQLKPTYNLAAYADKSETLKHFINIGVEIAQWDKHKDTCFKILRMDFEKDIKPYIFFLYNIGISADELGTWFTRNPFVFEHTLANVQTRVDYLKSKKFKAKDVATIVNRTPLWINYSILNLDKSLGNLQRKFKLSSAEVRAVTMKDPKLILHITDYKYNLEMMYRVVEGQMGYKPEEQKQLILNLPRLYRTNRYTLVKRFEIAHLELGLSHKMILSFPRILKIRESKLQERNGFLKFIGKNQYDPSKPNYISLKEFVEGTDAEFCSHVSSSIEMFNDYLKTV